jgi:hypothetical protein
MQEKLQKNGLADLSFHYDESQDKNHIALVFAVLERALYDYIGHGSLTGSFITDKREKIQIKNDAKNWFLSDKETPFSFLWVCDFLELCPNTIRQVASEGNAEAWRKIKTRCTLRSTERFFSHLFNEDTEEHSLLLPGKGKEPK